MTGCFMHDRQACLNPGLITVAVIFFNKDLMYAGIKEKKDAKGSERIFIFFSQRHHGSARSGALSGCLQAAFMCF